MTIPRPTPGTGPLALLALVATVASSACRVVPWTLDDPSPNIVWIVADRPAAGWETEPASLVGGVRFPTTGTIAADPASARSALLTGMHPVTLGLDDGGWSGVPPTGVRALPEHLRRSGYYTTRGAEARHNLAVGEDRARLGDTALRAQPGLLGAWDAAGPTADWRGMHEEWDHPCTVWFGCYGDPIITHYPEVDTRRPRAFFSLFDLGGLDGPAIDDAVERILERLEDDDLENDTALFFIGLDEAGVDIVVEWPSRIATRDARERPVILLDLAPTALALAKLEVPDAMQGRVFLGPTPDPPLTPGDLDAMAAAGAQVEPWPGGHPPRAARPGGFPTGGMFHIAPHVELWCDTEGSSIIYTTEREPPFYWRLYQGEFVMRFWTLRARCGRLGYADSELLSYEFEIE